MVGTVVTVSLPQQAAKAGEDQLYKVKAEWRQY